MLWNRKELYSGFSLDKFNEICDILSVNNINYKQKVVNRQTSALFDTNRSRTGTLGNKLNLSYEYYIYVHKDDYDKGYSLI